MYLDIHLAGYFIFIVAAAAGACFLNVPLQWVGMGVVCLVVVAILHCLASTRQKHPVA